MGFEIVFIFSPVLFHGLSFVVVMKLIACGQIVNEK